ncbi:MAG: methyltransferase domain-containing protein [Methanoregulaceae archaeon]|nr:MAG: methyltransferase domain-containing protein [Methanoregulaceae archaeon]
MSDMYVDGEYSRQNPTWDVEDAPWKADHIIRMMEKHHLKPGSVCEVGCGCGEILRQLQQRMDPSCALTGYDISPQAIELCSSRVNDRLQFKCSNFMDENIVSCDLMLIVDVIEHLEDYFRFLRTIKEKSRHVVLHIPLEMFVLSVLYPQFHLGQRTKVGHLHYFSKEIALQVLRDIGFEIVDYTYTAGYALPRNNGIKDRLLKIPRGIFFPFAPDFTARVFGGYSLLVLVR